MAGSASPKGKKGAAPKKGGTPAKKGGKGDAKGAKGGKADAKGAKGGKADAKGAKGAKGAKPDAKGAKKGAAAKGAPKKGKSTDSAVAKKGSKDKGGKGSATSLASAPSSTAVSEDSGKVVVEKKPPPKKAAEKPKPPPEPEKPRLTKVTHAPRIYASAYSDVVWTMLKDYTKEVLRSSPKDVMAWSADYFATKVHERRANSASYSKSQMEKRCSASGGELHTAPHGAPSPSHSAAPSMTSDGGRSTGAESRTSALST